MLYKAAVIQDRSDASLVQSKWCDRGIEEL